MFQQIGGRGLPVGRLTFVEWGVDWYPCAVMNKIEPYVGIHNDRYGGMTDIGRIIRDAWAFGLIPESETCAGWHAARIEELWEKVQETWDHYGFSVHNFPEELCWRYLRIQEEAVARAKALGWDPDRDLEDE